MRGGRHAFAARSRDRAARAEHEALTGGSRLSIGDRSKKWDEAINAYQEIEHLGDRTDVAIDAKFQQARLHEARALTDAKDTGDYNRQPKWRAPDVRQYLGIDDRYVYGRRADNAIVAMDIYRNAVAAGPDNPLPRMKLGLLCRDRFVVKQRTSAHHESQRGMLDETLVVMMGEFGRTPRFNASGAESGVSRANAASALVNVLRR